MKCRTGQQSKQSEHTKLDSTASQQREANCILGTVHTHRSLCRPLILATHSPQEAS